MKKKKHGKPRSATNETRRKGPKRHTTCSHCDTANPITAKFCMNCGEMLTN
nr:zinc-ribbon domain-containing protein [Desulfobacterales bacterium]